jgi:Spy/CpxP family protein refolding chaperone
MRKLVTLLALGTLGLFGACSNDAAGPGDDLDLVASFALNGGFAYGVEGGLPGRGLPELRRLDMLPDDIALTSAQESQISALLEAFQTEYQDELDALNEIHERAHAARTNGATREAVHDILEEGDTIRDELMEPLADLRDAINAVLTEAQKTWLLQRQYRRCDPASATPLTEAQQAQIEALREAFNTANQADLAAVKAAMDQAHEARRAGKSQTEIAAILAPVKEAMTRLQAAGEQLRVAIDAVLTPEQRASDCFGRGLGGPGMGPGGMGPGGMRPGRHAPRGW